MRPNGITWALGFALITVACTRTNERPVGAPVQIATPLGLPPVPVPADNPVTVETVALGRKLFYDRKLSTNDVLSCASCHNPQFGFSDGQRVSTGVEGKTGKRNAPTVLNAAYGANQFWDGRATSLEEQSAGPIANPIEMNQKHDVCVSRLNEDPAYVAEFEKAFGPGPITMGKIQKALASFDVRRSAAIPRSIDIEYGGRQDCASPAAIRGLAIFKDKNKGNCVTCHTIDSKHALFTDGKFHNLGIGVNSEGELVDQGRFVHTKLETDTGAFKTRPFGTLLRARRTCTTEA